MCKYFLSSEGVPDIEKTPEPLVLEDMTRTLRIRKAVNDVPGLYSKMGRLGYYHVVVIGWNRDAILERFGSLRRFHEEAKHSEKLSRAALRKHEAGVCHRSNRCGGRRSLSSGT